MNVRKILRIDEELAQDIKEISKQEDRSWNAQAINLLKTHPKILELRKDRPSTT